MTCESELLAVKTYPEDANTCVILIPGTFGRPEWPHIDNFAAKLGQLMPEAHIFKFPWSRSLRQRSRHAAAVRLARQLDVRSSKYRQILLIAHSHGRNVAL